MNQIIKQTNTIPSTPQIEGILHSLFPKRPILRILLVNPPDCHAEMFDADMARRGRYTNYPPYGLLILAARLRDSGIEVRVSHLNHAVLKASRTADSGTEFDHDSCWREGLRGDINDFVPDLIGVTCMFTMTHTSLKQVCEEISGTGVPIVIGGVHCSNDSERVLDDISSARALFLREADTSFLNFIEVLNGNAPIGNLAQVIFNDDGRRLRIDVPATPDEGEIDTIPAWDLVDTRNAGLDGIIGVFTYLKPKGTRFGCAISNRGCRAQCTFCSVRNFNGTGVRQRSIEAVVDELEILEAEHGIEHFMWLDDDLLKDERRAISLFDAMVRRGLAMTWDASNGVIAYSCTAEVVDAAAASGCIGINIGVESGNREILKRIRKPGTPKIFLQASENIRRHEKIYSAALLMVGFPGETLAMVQDTIELARDMQLDWYRIAPLQPLPNTPIFEELRSEGLVQEVGSAEIRYAGGAFGKQLEIEQGRRLATPNFREAFQKIEPNAVLLGHQIPDIWFYMNYHLNFYRSFSITNPVKAEQRIRTLENLVNVITPENAFGLYFLAYLQHKFNGVSHSDIISRLNRRLKTSAYWRDRFQSFGLSVDDFGPRKFHNAMVNPIYDAAQVAAATP